MQNSYRSWDYEEFQCYHPQVDLNIYRIYSSKHKRISTWALLACYHQLLCVRDSCVWVYIEECLSSPALCYYGVMHNLFCKYDNWVNIRLPWVACIYTYRKLLKHLFFLVYRTHTHTQISPLLTSLCCHNKMQLCCGCRTKRRKKILPMRLSNLCMFFKENCWKIIKKLFSLL